MTALADNLFKYYSKPHSDSDTAGGEPKDTKIEVISEEEAKKPPLPPSPPPPKPRGPLLTGKRIILAVILFLIAVDIPVGLRLLRQYQDSRTTASTPLPTAQPPALAPSPTTAPSPIPPSPTSPTVPAGEAGRQVTPITPITPIPTVSPAPTTQQSQTSSFGTTELDELPVTDLQPPTPTETDELAQTAIQTHAECFNGACIEVEGTGVDQCIIDDDCLQPSPTEALIEIPDTPIPLPDTPAAGSITNTLIGILSGLGILLVALLL